MVVGYQNFRKPPYGAKLTRDQAREIHRTQIIKDNLDPEWNEVAGICSDGNGDSENLWRKWPLNRGVEGLLVPFDIPLFSLFHHVSP